MNNHFRTPTGRHWFEAKYALFRGETWEQKANTIVDEIAGTCGGTQPQLLCNYDLNQLGRYITKMKFIPAGRYIYYAGRSANFINNCYLMRAEEDTREEWSRLMSNTMAALMCGGGVGTDYSILREEGALIKRTGGLASGPIPLMKASNEVGRNVMQGGARRSALYASLIWKHPDIRKFLTIKNWHDIKVSSNLSLWDIKKDNYDFPAPLDMTNISVNWDDDWLRLKDRHLNEIWMDNVRQALSTSEPGFSFNFGDKSNETLRNACTEVTSSDDSDVCNLGSINLANIHSLDELRDVTNLASKFLICGSLRAELPYDKVQKVRDKNRRLGLGLMGVHEWLLRNGQRYEATPELHEVLGTWRYESERGANELCDMLGISRPVGYRAIAPTGTIGGLAGTTTGIEPLFAVAYKRRYVADSNRWKYEYVVDGTAQTLIDEYGYHPDYIETALSLAEDPERRIKFQADVQGYVDHAISSTINLPAWGSELNNPDTAEIFSKMLSKYAPRLRGLTCYADGSRGGQPLTAVDYNTAVKHKGVVYEEMDVCSLTGGGICGS